MKIHHQKTKYDLEDVVWFMYKNCLCRGIVTRCLYTQEDSVYIHGSETQSIVEKIKSFLHLRKTNVTIIYDVDLINNDNIFLCAGPRSHEHQLFKTKEELLKSL